MNRDFPSEAENQDLEAQRAAAREDVRARVEAGQKRRDEAERTEQQRRRRSLWEFAPDSTRGFLFEIFGDRLVLFLGLGALWLVISSVFWLAEALRWPLYLLIRSLDLATGAHSLPVAPWLAWTLWGGVFGGCLGYWLVAPIYGDRENRSFMLLVPLLAMITSAALLWAFVR